MTATAHKIPTDGLPAVAPMAGGTGGIGTAADRVHQFITFTIDRNEYGVDIMAVREIKGWTHATRLPNAPIHVRGVINLRGTMVPVFDLRARFGLGETDAGKTHVVIIVSVAARIVGMLVDTVSDILTVAEGDIRPVPEIDRDFDGDYLAGLVSVEDRMVALLTLETLFGATLSAPGFTPQNLAQNLAQNLTQTLALPADLPQSA